MPVHGCLSLLSLILTAAIVRGDLRCQEGHPLPIPGDGGIAGWSRSDTVRVYQGEDLYDFIDGGADLFFEYGFRRAAAVEYQNTIGQQIKLEMYEMNDPAASYGIYSIKAAAASSPVDIGQEGRVHPYYLMFWKGTFYVSVAGSDSSEECRRGLETIARSVDRRISERGEMPVVVGLLPKENLLVQRYFRGFLGLSTARVFDEEDISRCIDGASGTYDDHTLLVFRYASAAEASERLADINTDLASSVRFRDYTRHDEMSTVVDRRNRVLCLGQAGEYIFVSAASQEAIALDACRKACSSVR